MALINTIISIQFAFFVMCFLRDIVFHFNESPCLIGRALPNMIQMGNSEKDTFKKARQCCIFLQFSSYKRNDQYQHEAVFERAGNGRWSE